MKKSSAFSLSIISLLFGIILGFLLSPVKKGIEVGSNCGNRYYKLKDCDKI